MLFSTSEMARGHNLSDNDLNLQISDRDLARINYTKLLGVNVHVNGTRRVLANNKENERPKYVDPGKRDEQVEEKVFDNIEEASSFWKELWEGNETGNGSAEWLHDLRAIIYDRVLPSVKEAWDLVTSEAVNVLARKKNWSAPGPDRIANFWCKRA